MEGRLTEGFSRYRFGGLIFGGVYTWRGLFSEFYGIRHHEQGRSQDFSKGGSQTGTPSGDRRLYMVYTAALPRVSAGSVVLTRHEGPY